MQMNTMLAFGPDAIQYIFCAQLNTLQNRAPRTIFAFILVMVKWAKPERMREYQTYQTVSTKSTPFSITVVEKRSRFPIVYI